MLKCSFIPTDMKADVDITIDIRKRADKRDICHVFHDKKLTGERLYSLYTHGHTVYAHSRYRSSVVHQIEGIRQIKTLFFWLFQLLC